MKKISLLLLMAFIVFGCAHTGSTPDSNLTWLEGTVMGNYQSIYRRYEECFHKQAGGYWGHWGFWADSIGEIFTDTKEAYLNIYLYRFPVGQTEILLGHIRFKSDENGNTIVRVATEPEKRRQEWLGWADSDSACK